VADRRTAAIDADVCEWMSAPAITISADAPIGDLDALLERRRISGVPVTGAAGELAGVVSRTDLLRAGRPGGPGRHGILRPVLAVPDGLVRDVMQPTVVTVASNEPLSRACRYMVRKHVHRVVAVEPTRPDTVAGVLTTRDVMHALAEARADLPLETVMTRNVMSIDIGDSMRAAAERLAAAHKHALVVLDRGWPVGTVGIDEVLQAREWPAEVEVGDWMNLRVLCLPLRTALHRAAAHALAVGARQVLVLADDGLAGVLTGIDFARVVR
jgi:CBS domain-containing protein